MIKQCKFISMWYSVLFISCLAIALIIAGILNMWTLVYPVILITPFIYCLLLMKTWISNLLTFKVNQNWSKKKVMWSSILLHISYMILMFVPLLVGILINVYVIDIFNVYMLISYFLISILVSNVIRCLYWKKTNKEQGKEKLNG